MKLPSSCLFLSPPILLETLTATWSRGPNVRHSWRRGNNQDFSNVGYLRKNGRRLTELDKLVIMTFQVQLRVKAYKGTPGPVVRYWPILINPSFRCQRFLFKPYLVIRVLWSVFGDKKNSNETSFPKFEYECP